MTEIRRIPFYTHQVMTTTVTADAEEVPIFEEVAGVGTPYTFNSTDRLIVTHINVTPSNTGTGTVFLADGDGTKRGDDVVTLIEYRDTISGTGSRNYSRELVWDFKSGETDSTTPTAWKMWIQADQTEAVSVQAKGYIITYQ